MADLNFNDYLHLAAGGALAGAILAVFPLCVGLFRRRWKRAFLAALLCVVLGAAFGFFAALPASVIATLGLWRKEPGAAKKPAPIDIEYSGKT